MAVLTVQDIKHTGLNPSFVAAASGGDQVPNDGRTFIYVKNGGGGSINVTVDQKKKCNHGFDHDAVVAVPAGQERIIGPFTKHDFDNASNQFEVTYSGVTTVTVAAIRLTETGR